MRVDVVRSYYWFHAISGDIMAPMKRILVQLTDEQLSALRANLEKKGAPIARQIREAVEQYLKKKK
jgi:hypothetical protein